MSSLVAGVVAWTWAASAWAAPASSAEHVEARLEIDTSQAGTGAEVLHRRIEERANIVLRHGKVLPGDREDAALMVSIREVGGDEPGYVVSFELRGPDGARVGEVAEIECALCTETELVARVESELETVIPALRELERAPEQEASEPAPPAPAPPSQGSRTDATSGPRGSVGMLAGGITLLIVGGGSLGAGVGLALREPTVDRDDPLDLITTRPVGYALLAGGIALAGTGAVLTALAVKRRARARWSVAPLFDRGHAGVTVGWRFR